MKTSIGIHVIGKLKFGLTVGRKGASWKGIWNAEDGSGGGGQ